MQPGEGIAEGGIDGTLVGSRVEGDGAADVAVVAGDVDLHVELDRLARHDRPR